MNPLVTLLLAAAATGADPQPVVTETVTPVSSTTYADAAPDNHTGFFGRIRNALNGKSSPAPETYSSQPYYGGPGVTAETTVPSAPRFVPSGSSAEPPLADTVPVTTPAPVQAPVNVQPVAPPPVVAQPTYTYPAPAATGTAEPSRSKLFPRLRKLLGGSSSQPSQALPEGAIVTPQYSAPPAPTPAPAPVQAAPVIQGQPQRLPIGNP